MKQTYFLLVAAMLLGVTPTFANSIKNKDLFSACTGSTSAEQNFCYGFIISAANAAQYYRNMADVQGGYLDICFPPTITNKDLVETYVDWVKQYPSVLERAAFVGVSSALSTKYSCQDNPES